MKFTTLLLAVLCSLASLGQIETARQLLAVSSIDETSNQELIDLTEGYNLKENPVLYAYHAAALMTMANHVYWPGTKLDYFNDGKEKLEKAVNFALTNVEIRFIRYSVQNGAPLMLGYSDDMEADKKYILANIDKANWSVKYKQEVRDFLIGE